MGQGRGSTVNRAEVDRRGVLVWKRTGTCSDGTCPLEATPSVPSDFLFQDAEGQTD
jgi:hypothetical protein